MALALAGCSGGGEGAERAPASSETTAVEAATSSTSTLPAPTTVAPVSTTARPATTTPPSPEAAAKSLFDAWTRADRAAAARVAEPAAITALFARTWQAGDGWAFSECTGAAGSFICTWARPAGQQVLLRVQTTTARVAEVRFQP